MIYSLTGKILDKTAAEVVIDCGGVGYAAFVPSTALGALGPVGSEATIYTHMSVSENNIALYGFESPENRDIFRILTSVSGVGPKSGISILSVLNVQQIVIAVSSGDYKAFTAASGIGPKIAQRIVLELKDKLAKSFSVDAIGPASPGSSIAGGSGGGQMQAIAALMSLGYTQAEAAKSVQSIDSTLPTPEIIRIALQGMGGKK